MNSLFVSVSLLPLAISNSFCNAVMYEIAMGIAYLRQHDNLEC